MRNQLLSAFARSSPKQYSAFARQSEEVPLRRGERLNVVRARTDFVYFVNTGSVSLVATTDAGYSLDVAIIGSEGAAGITDALGQYPMPSALMVLVDGDAIRVPTSAVREHVLACSELHDLLMAYSQLVMHQLAQSALCNCFHTSVQRLARWLLMTSDRAGTRELPLTHELIAQMVGAPRSAVTQAAGKLRDRGLISYRRGILEVINPLALQRVACECYNAVPFVSTP